MLIRSSEPLLIKDHTNRIPVKRIAFKHSQNLVCSMDNAMLKIWDETSGKQTAYIESTSNFNDFCTIPNSGMFFFAQEEPKMMSFYILALSPAPRSKKSSRRRCRAFKTTTTSSSQSRNSSNLASTKSKSQIFSKLTCTATLLTCDCIKKRCRLSIRLILRNRKEKVFKKIEESRPARLQIKSDLPKG